LFAACHFLSAAGLQFALLMFFHHFLNFVLAFWGRTGRSSSGHS
jgi:hypothetical protein